MKNIKIVIPRQRPRNPVAVPARKRKAGPHRDRREKRATARDRRGMWDEVWMELQELDEDEKAGRQ